MIKRSPLKIDGIPAVISGDKSEKVFIAIHGSMSDKDDIIIKTLAETVNRAGYQVLSFDLPKHGERKEENTPCKAKECVEDLNKIMSFAMTQWKDISLFACSIGAYFSLIAYKKTRFTHCLFISPVTDMISLINRMMQILDITPEKLETEKEISAPLGQTLYWDYYSYVIKHPVKSWKSPTNIFCAAQDEICSIGMMQEFAKKFHAKMMILKDSHHYIHTQTEIKICKKWINGILNDTTKEKI